MGKKKNVKDLTADSSQQVLVSKLSGRRTKMTVSTQSLLEESKYDLDSYEGYWTECESEARKSKTREHIRKVGNKKALRQQQTEEVSSMFSGVETNNTQVSRKATGRRTKTNLTVDKTQDVVSLQDYYAESEGENSITIHRESVQTTPSAQECDDLALTATKVSREPHESCDTGLVASLDNVGVSGVESVKSAKNTKETFCQQNAKSTGQSTPLRRSKRNKRLSDNQQFSESNSVPVTMSLLEKTLERSVKRQGRSPSYANRKSTKTPHNQPVGVQNDPQIRSTSVIQAGQAEGEPFHDSQAAGYAPSSPEYTYNREAHQSPAEITALAQASDCVDARCDEEEEDENGAVDVEYANTSDSDEVKIYPNSSRKCISLKENNSHMKLELPRVKDKPLYSDDKSSHVTEVGRPLALLQMTMSIAGEATGSWTKIVRSDSKDHTLEDPLMLQPSRKRLTYSADPPPCFAESLQDKGNCSLDDTEQAFGGEELVDVGVESFGEMHKGKYSAAEAVMQNVNSTRQTPRKPSVKSDPKLRKSQKAKSVKKLGNERAEANEEKQYSVQTQHKRQKDGGFRANRSFDLAQTKILTQSGIQGTVNENPMREGGVVLESAVENKQDEKSIKIKRKRGRPKKVSQLRKQCPSATDTESAFVCLSPYNTIVKTGPAKRAGASIRTSKDQGTSQTAITDVSKKVNQAVKCTVKDRTVSENMSTASLCSDEAHRRMDLELDVEEEDDEDFVILDSSRQNSVKTSGESPCCGLKTKRKRTSDAEKRNSSVRGSVVSPHPTNNESDCSLIEFKGTKQKGLVCVVSSPAEQSTPHKVMPRGRRKKTTTANKVSAGKKRFPVVVVSKLSSSPFQRFQLEEGGVKLAKPQCEEPVPAATAPRKSRKKVSKKVSKQPNDESEYVTPVRKPPVLKMSDFDQVKEYDTDYNDYSAIAGSFSGPSFRPKRRKFSELEQDEAETSLINSPPENSPGEDDQEERNLTGAEDTKEDNDLCMAHSELSQSLDITPHVQNPASGIQKRQQRRVTINSIVLPSPTHHSEPSATPATVRKSILKTPGTNSKTKSYSETPLSEAPVHYWEMTRSDTPAVGFVPQATENKKIIQPAPAPEGLRRSQRTRLKPLAWYQNERAVYDKRKSGGFLIVDVAPPAVDPTQERTNKLKRKAQQAKRQQTMELKERRLSVHVSLPEKVKLASGGNIMVRNPATANTETLEGCIGTQTSAQYWGPTGQQGQTTDPYVLCKYFQEKAFSAGELVIRPMEEKPTQTVSESTMIFSILEGKLAVTIHETTSILQKRDVFYIPPENTYSLKNLRKTSAKLFFTQVRGNATLNAAP
ncbi:uncharacterized protein LOC135471240 [Liolophura sinensis]|uniref:uncharacterized protein LOC135471240 n=1 Tax=Liolophura sinensis TaxID=3198878 RepID=UPI0031590DDF